MSANQMYSKNIIATYLNLSLIANHLIELYFQKQISS